MTINEFSAKYGIPYHLVYEASYRVNPVEPDIRDRDYPEDILFSETHRIVTARIKKHRAHLDKLSGMMDRLTGGFE